MASVHRLDRPAAAPGRVTFSRAELRLLLDEYSRRVAAGEWRDYAVDYRSDRAAFAMFRHTAEFPLYMVEKVVGRDGQPLWRLLRGREKLRQGRNLPDILAAIERRPRLVTLF
ncbi:MAG: DUF2794 domain-containing protein [Alphaproteobacteria bacterium]|nr:DUF2794 domain-containing protein [Alphaproteobacteria bacterium]